MKPEDIQKELDKFHNRTPVEPGCRLHGGFTPFQLELFAPPVGTWRMGPEAPNNDIRLDGDNVVVTALIEREFTDPSKGRRKETVITENRFPCEAVAYTTMIYCEGDVS